MLQAKKQRAHRRTPEEWHQLIIACEASGQGQRDFCRDQGLGYSTFCKWKQRLTSDTRSPELDLIEITPPATEPTSNWEVELTLGSGMILRINRR